MLGIFLRSLRKSKGFSQTEAANLAGLQKNSAIRIEKDPFPYGVDKLIKYSNSIGYDVEIHFVDKENRGNTSVYK